MSAVTANGKVIDLQPFDADLLRLTFEAGADGFAIVDIDGSAMPPIDLAQVAATGGLILIACPGHQARSYGLTWMA